MCKERVCCISLQLGTKSFLSRLHTSRTTATPAYLLYLRNSYSDSVGINILVFVQAEDGSVNVIEITNRSITSQFPTLNTENYCVDKTVKIVTFCNLLKERGDCELELTSFRRNIWMLGLQVRRLLCYIPNWSNIYRTTLKRIITSKYVKRTWMAEGTIFITISATSYVCITVHITCAGPGGRAL
jgi:hypothetical protein